MWRETLHPRDEYGRFRLLGPSGTFDRLAGALENQRHARNIHAWEQNQELQSRYWNRRKAGMLTAEEDAHWDVIGEQAKGLLEQLPSAYHKGLRPEDDGTWRYPEKPQGGAYDDRGRRLPHAAELGWTRVGDHPQRMVLRPGERAPGHGGVVRERDSPLAGGVWHRPGEYGPGRVPVLRNDFGHSMSQLEPELSKSHKRRQQAGTFARAEDRAERILGHRLRDPQDESSYPSSADVFGGFLASPTNPTGRRRSARKKRDRQQTVTWIQRLSDRMEGR